MLEKNIFSAFWVDFRPILDFLGILGDFGGFLGNFSNFHPGGQGGCPPGGGQGGLQNKSLARRKTLDGKSEVALAPQIPPRWTGGGVHLQVDRGGGVPLEVDRGGVAWVVSIMYVC